MREVWGIKDRREGFRGRRDGAGGGVANPSSDTLYKRRRQKIEVAGKKRVGQFPGFSG